MGNQDKNIANIGLSIGDVAKATGIGVHTLRVWERRYGAPASQKLPSGHRRYEVSEVRRLRLVKAALDSGLKPKDVVKLPVADLLHQLGGLVGAEGATYNLNLLSDRVIQATASFDEQALMDIFHDEWRKNGPVGFITEKAGSIIGRIGEAWAHGQINVAMEHFISEILQDFLSSHWRQLNKEAKGQPWVLSALPDDLHAFGLQMVATLLTTMGQRVIFLGPSTPVQEIAESARQNQVEGIAISISSWYPAKRSIQYISDIRHAVSDNVIIACGGDGAPTGIQGITNFRDMSGFYEWLQGRQNINPAVKSD